MNSRQLGRFRISEFTLQDDPARVEFILRKLKAIPVRVELMFAYRAFEYTAISPMFKECKIGDEIPWYEIVVIEDMFGGPDTVEVKEP